jgi:hypothetical protein
LSREAFQVRATPEVVADDTRTFVGVVGGFLSARGFRALAPLAAPATKTVTTKTAKVALERAMSIRAADTTRALSAGCLFLRDPRKGERLSRGARGQLRLRITLIPRLLDDWTRAGER